MQERNPEADGDALACLPEAVQSSNWQPGPYSQYKVTTAETAEKSQAYILPGFCSNVGSTL